MDIHDYPAVLKLHPQIRQMKSEEAREFVFSELLAAMKQYTAKR